MEAYRAAEHFYRCFEQYHGGGAVDVVVAVDQDRLASLDRRLYAQDCGAHAQHRVRIKQVIEVRVQVAFGRGQGSDSAGNKQRGNHQGYLRGAGELGGEGLIKPGEGPCALLEA